VTFTEANIARLQRGVVQCQEVLNVPRRLGGDATDKELADDKRMARRIKHRLEVALVDWLGFERHQAFDDPPPDGTGARLAWGEWWEGWRATAIELRARADNNSQQHAIDRELEGMAHVMAEFRS
jgi:hypothetical protein